MRLKKKYRLYLSKGDIAKAEIARDDYKTVRSETCPIAQSIKRHLKLDGAGVGNVGASLGGSRSYLLSKKARQVVRNFDDRKPVSPTHFTLTRMDN